MPELFFNLHSLIFSKSQFSCTIAIPVPRKGDHAPAVTDPITFPSSESNSSSTIGFSEGHFMPLIFIGLFSFLTNASYPIKSLLSKSINFCNPRSKGSNL